MELPSDIEFGTNCRKYSRRRNRSLPSSRNLSETTPGVAGTVAVGSRGAESLVIRHLTVSRSPSDDPLAIEPRFFRARFARIRNGNSGASENNRSKPSCQSLTGGSINSGIFISQETRNHWFPAHAGDSGDFISVPHNGSENRNLYHNRVQPPKAEGTRIERAPCLITGPGPAKKIEGFRSISLRFASTFLPLFGVPSALSLVLLPPPLSVRQAEIKRRRIAPGENGGRPLNSVVTEAVFSCLRKYSTLPAV